MGEIDNLKKNKLKNWKNSDSDYAMKEIKQDEALGRVCILQLTLVVQKGEGSTTQECNSNSGGEPE